MIVIHVLFWCSVAVILAALEIEIEGKYGWAERLPTWYRTTGAPARIFGLLSSGKPLTGYHLFLQLFILAIFHVPFLHGTPWNGAAELAQIALFILFWVMEDAAWFILNPHYGTARIERGVAWWFAKSRWIGNMPIDYAIGAGAFTALMAASGALAGHGAVVGCKDALLMLLFASMFHLLLPFAAPIYHEWYHRMRRTDDRDKAGIFHRE